MPSQAAPAAPVFSTISRLHLLLMLILASLLLMAIFAWIGAPLNTLVAPSGIVSYELARTPSRSSAILSSWDFFARAAAAFGLGLDYLFMVVYGSALILSSQISGASLAHLGWPLARLSRWLVLASFLAVVFDALENIFLMVMLFQGVQSPLPQLAWVCAVLKFALIFLALVYAFYALAVKISSRLLPDK